MTRCERAWQLIPLLKWAAMCRQELSYQAVEDLTSLPMRAAGQCLDPVWAWCRAKGLPPLTCLMVSEKDGLPGERFFQQTGLTPETLPRWREAVFAYEWETVGCPTVTELELAMEALPAGMKAATP